MAKMERQELIEVIIANLEKLPNVDRSSLPKTLEILNMFTDSNLRGYYAAMMKKQEREAAAKARKKKNWENHLKVMAFCNAPRTVNESFVEAQRNIRKIEDAGKTLAEKAASISFDKVNESVAPRPKTFTPRKSNPNRFEPSAKTALKQGNDIKDVTLRYGAQHTLEGAKELVNEALEEVKKEFVRMKRSGINANKTIKETVEETCRKDLDSISDELADDVDELIRNLDGFDKYVEKKLDEKLDEHEIEDQQRRCLIKELFIKTMECAAINEFVMPDVDQEDNEILKLRREVTDAQNERAKLHQELGREVEDMKENAVRLAETKREIDALWETKIPAVFAKCDQAIDQYNDMSMAAEKALEKVEPINVAEFDSWQLIELTEKVTSPPTVDVNLEFIDSMGQTAMGLAELKHTYKKQDRKAKQNAALMKERIDNELDPELLYDAMRPFLAANAFVDADKFIEKARVLKELMESSH